MKNGNTSLRMGRTIAERREKIQSDSERLHERKKSKQKKALRLSLTIMSFVIFAGLVIAVALRWVNDINAANVELVEVEDFSPTIEIVNEVGGVEISAKITEYVGYAEADFRDLGYEPVRAVLPISKVREVDFYLANYDGYIKMNIDRGTAVSVEDADRMIRYLQSVGVEQFEYIDVRIEGKAYYK